MKPNIIPGPTGFRIEAEGHLSDAILQAWTWRFFRQHARDLGGAAWRREPTFTTEEGALKWVSTVRDWFAIVHSGCGFEVSSGDYPALAMAFATRTQSVMGRYGIVKKVNGEDLGWTPIAWTKRWGWSFCDGSYGLIYHLEDSSPPRQEFESEDDYSERIDDIVRQVEGGVIAGLEAGLVSGVVAGFEWSFVKSENYPDGKI